MPTAIEIMPGDVVLKLLEIRCGAVSAYLPSSTDV
jgi:hypothetical protein